MPKDISLNLSPDLMSALLMGMRLRGVHYRRIEVTPPFGFRFSMQPGQAQFHFVTSGCVVLEDAEGDLHTLAPGTAAFLPHGGTHQVLSAPDAPVKEVGSLAAEPICADLCNIEACASEPGCPNNTILFSGSMAFELGAMQGLIRLMPAVMQVDTLAERHPEIPVILKAMEREVCGQRVGFAGILARLAEVVSAIIVRGWVECGCSGASGLVDALRDPRLARAVAAVHRDPGRAWTVASLALEAGCSRSVFAERFQNLMGVPPLHYLGELRMRLAAQWIGTDGMPIETVASTLGYASQAAFARAFKRVIGQPPGALRLSTAPAKVGLRRVAAV